ncbi:MAG: hypothetical protein ABWJ42_01610, partial [Sulfolobales archaeon]
RLGDGSLIPLSSTAAREPAGTSKPLWARWKSLDTRRYTGTDEREKIWGRYRTIDILIMSKFIVSQNNFISL